MNEVLKKSLSLVLALSDRYYDSSADTFYKIITCHFDLSQGRFSILPERVAS